MELKWGKFTTYINCSVQVSFKDTYCFNTYILYAKVLRFELKSIATAASLQGVKHLFPH